MAPDSHQVSASGMASGNALDTAVQPGALQGSAVTSGIPATQSVAPPVLNAGAVSGDDLEQDWVEKAKDIVEQTKNDPFTQSIELSKVKADFLKTRYNKQINGSEDQS